MTYPTMAEIDPNDVILWLVPHIPVEFPDIPQRILAQNRSRLVETIPTSPNNPVTAQEEESGAESPSHHESSDDVKGGLVFLFSRGA